MLCDFGWISLMILFFPHCGKTLLTLLNLNFFTGKVGANHTQGWFWLCCLACPSWVQLGHPAQSRRRDDCIGAMFAEEEGAWT